MNTQDILAERGKRYGSFESNASLAQMIKDIMQGTDNWERMDDDQKEALHMIASKISRILSADYNYDDNWKDIAGYATLVAERLQGNKI